MPGAAGRALCLHRVPSLEGQVPGGHESSGDSVNLLWGLSPIPSRPASSLRLPSLTLDFMVQLPCTSRAVPTGCGLRAH